MKKKVLSIVLCVMTISSLLSCIPFTASASDAGYVIKYLDDDNCAITGYKEKGTDLVIPETINNCRVTQISAYAFYGNENLKSVKIPDSVKIIEYSAFDSCVNLSKIELPKSLTEIGNFAFYNTAFYNDKNNWYNGVLYLDNYLITADSDIVKGSYTIKNGTKMISNSAFEYCERLTSISIPDSVDTFGFYAFNNCSSLKKFVFPKNIKTIPPFTLLNCINITEIVLPYGVEIIDESAFDDCDKLKNVNIPNTVKKIDRNAFYGCNGLRKVIVPKSVTEIMDGNFTDYIEYVDNGTTTADFKLYCYKGTAAEKYAIENNIKYVLLPDNEYEYETLADKTVKATSYIGATKKCILIPNKLNDLILSTLGYGTFKGCDYIEKVLISNTVTAIDDNVFEECKNITIYAQKDSYAAKYAAEHEIAYKEVLFGDANNDNSINMKDVLILRKHIAGYSIDINKDNIDLNFDQSINMKDVLLIRKHIAGQAVAPWE